MSRPRTSKKYIDEEGNIRRGEDATHAQATSLARKFMANFKKDFQPPTDRPASAAGQSNNWTVASAEQNPGNKSSSKQGPRKCGWSRYEAVPPSPRELPLYKEKNKSSPCPPGEIMHKTRPVTPGRTGDFRSLTSDPEPRDRSGASETSKTREVPSPELRLFTDSTGEVYVTTSLDVLPDGFTWIDQDGNVPKEMAPHDGERSISRQTHPQSENRNVLKDTPPQSKSTHPHKEDRDISEETTPHVFRDAHGETYMAGHWMLSELPDDFEYVPEQSENLSNQTPPHREEPNDASSDVQLFTKDSGVACVGLVTSSPGLYEHSEASAEESGNKKAYFRARGDLIGADLEAYEAVEHRSERADQPLVADLQASATGLKVSTLAATRKTGADAPLVAAKAKATGVDVAIGTVAYDDSSAASVADVEAEATGVSFKAFNCTLKTGNSPAVEAKASATGVGIRICDIHLGRSAPLASAPASVTGLDFSVLSFGESQGSSGAGNKTSGGANTGGVFVPGVISGGKTTDGMKTEGDKTLGTNCGGESRYGTQPGKETGGISKDGTRYGGHIIAGTKIGDKNRGQRRVKHTEDWG